MSDNPAEGGDAPAAGEAPVPAPRVYARMCPVCFTANTPPADACRACGAGTSWESDGAFREFFLREKREGSLAFLKYAAVLFLGLIFSVTCLVVLREAARRGHLGLSLVALAGSIGLAVHGALHMARARKRLLFE